MTVRDAAGRAVHSPLARLVGGDVLRAARHRSASNEIEIVGPAPALDVEVWAEGYRAVVLAGITGHHEVRLEPGLPVAVRVSRSAALAEGETLTATLELVAGEHGHRVDAAPIEANGDTVLRAPFPGRYRVALWLRSERGYLTRRLGDAAEEPAFEVGAAGRARPLELDCPPAWLEAAREGPLR